ncbi:hypothetical protein Nepgr_001620 [Nepenthes gracilis]|uniref:Uncharacterized protein n=1 Tax=Nepenthes gracilis TaxID=150966 RepID=A0AAD3RXM6_NEPGR|nr:hypothetical protein Nepgr_001620 [Nepenthes gracilis]
MLFLRSSLICATRYFTLSPFSIRVLFLPRSPIRISAGNTQEMGFVSRKVFPACGRMCICCPALRSRSRQPVKRYKKLVSDIFPKSPDGQPSERKIVKLCEYAAKNPLRIPKITKYIEERFYKELRYGHVKIINVIAEAYNKLLCICGNQMAYFAGSLLNVTAELLDSSKEEALQIVGCQILTRFIYNQTDGTYAHTIENLVHQVCVLVLEARDGQCKQPLRASSLQCLSAVVWFMAEFPYYFDYLDEIVHITLDNYVPHMHNENGELEEQHHHWVDEVVRYEGRGSASICDTSPIGMIIRPRPERKDPCSLTREEIESPKIWAQICLQRMSELAKESTTIRRILEPMFVYFDTGNHWVPQQGLAVRVLSDLCYFVEISENKLLVLAGVVRHLDHKNVSNDPIIKANVIRVATYLTRQIRVETTLVDIGCVNDLCRHLRKTLQAIAAPNGEEETNLNVQLQNSLEACLLEIAKGVTDARPMFDLMVITLEKLPPVGVVARATIYSLIILVHVFSLVSLQSYSQQVFPDTLVLQLLKAMLHPDVEARIGAHQIFSMLLFCSSNQIKLDATSWRSGYCSGTRKWQSGTASTFASVAALLEKLRKEKDGSRTDKYSNDGMDGLKGGEFSQEESFQGWTHKKSPTFCNITSIIDRTAGSTNFTEAEPYVMKLSEDQVAQLLSGFWIQANLPDNLPSNFEAIAHSYCLTLISSHLKNTNHNLVIRFFQLPLSLRNVSLATNCGMLPPACRRSILVSSTAMLMFAAKIYHMHDLNDLLKSLIPFDVDPFLGISEDLQVFAKSNSDVRQFCSATDNEAAIMLLSKLQDKKFETEKLMLDILAQHLCWLTEVKVEDILNQLSEAFSPDDSLMFVPQSILDLDRIQLASHSKESSSVDGELPNSVMEDDVTSVLSIPNIPHYVPKVSPAVTRIISIGQLLESALEVAGQVAGTSVSTSPLPYSAIASQCEALGAGTRKKLSNWLSHENHLGRTAVNLSPANSPCGSATISKMTTAVDTFQESGPLKDRCSTLTLPPASPFDNFLRAVSAPKSDLVEVFV